MPNRSEPAQGNTEVLSTNDSIPNGQINASSKTELATNDIITRGPAKTLVLARPAKEKSNSSIAEVLVNEYVSNGDKQSKKSYDSASSSTGRECFKMVRLHLIVLSDSTDASFDMSVDCRPSIDRLSTDARPTLGRDSVTCRSILVRLSTESRRHPSVDMSIQESYSTPYDLFCLISTQFLL